MEPNTAYGSKSPCIQGKDDMGKKIKVLIVEDEAIFAMSMRRVLIMLGYEACGPVSTGEEAVHWAKKENLDLIIMDVSLKGRIDGIEAAGKIRLAHNVPIIFISGYQEEKLLEKARSVEFTSYLIKPIMPDDFKSAIEQTFKNQKSAFNKNPT